MTVQTANYYEAVEHLPPASTLIFDDVSWEEYEELLDQVGEARGLRISYDSGKMQVMTLSSEHEKYSTLIQDLVRTVSLRLRIRLLSFGSMTMKKPTRHGVEPDQCFYVQTAQAVENRTRINFDVDPPPDVVVEVDLNHESLSKFPIYSALGVPEIWRFDGRSMTIYCQQDGEYIPADSSRALPLLTSNVLTEFLTLSKTKDQYETLLAFEEWLSAHKS